MFRFVSPAGVPIKISTILRAFGRSLAFNGQLEPLSLGSRLKVRYLLATSSGRAALCVVLRSLHRLRPDRDIVAVPAYTCFSVPAAVVRAGLRVFPVDVDPQTLDFDFSQLEKLPSHKLLGIMTSSLFGLVSDGERLEQVARAKNAFLVDDAAQALGASRNGRMAGTFGAVGLYSLGRGKALPAGEGGIIVTNSEEVALTLEQEIAKLPELTRAHTAQMLAQMLAYAFFLNPRFYWIANSLPFLKLGVTEFDPDFALRRLAPLARALLAQMIGRLDPINQARAANAASLSRILEGNPRFAVPKPAPGTRPSYIRFPILVQDESERPRLLAALRAAGIGGSPSYPSAICDIPDLRASLATEDYHCPQAEAVSRRLVTLPTHGFVGPQDLRTMADLLRPGGVRE